MDDFFPFIYQPRKKEQELEPLYIEIGPPPQVERKPEKKEPSEERGVIIIQL